MANRLAHETSPYLLQHKDNPVDWRPWSQEALAEAAERGVPILLSIGYSACHWCHVMERESFEDEQTAQLMNDNFVCVKLDREERPDLDSIYMDACRALTGGGGWPLNVFLTPEQVPFYAGTYFPPEDRPGMPSWRVVLAAVAEGWRERADEIRSAADRVTQRLQGGAALEPSADDIEAGLPDAAAASLQEIYDSVNGGFGGAPKFPPASALDFLLGYASSRGGRDAPSDEGISSREGRTPLSGKSIRMSIHTLRAMASGGMYDQVGGGFARYSVDERWLVPHFEKMLYDNALLARAYLHGFQVSGDLLLRRVAEETLGWMIREMRGPEGGFMSALDADSEGEEGLFYVWTPEQLREALEPADAAVAADYFGVRPGGNFEGRTILTRGSNEPENLDDIRRRLYRARSQRVWPGLDDKRLCAWNALAISALAEAGAVLEREDFLDAARGAAEFVLRDLRDEAAQAERRSLPPVGQAGEHRTTHSRRLLRTYKDGQAKLNAYLEDHAFLLEALLTLYQATFDPRWFAEARELADTMIERFADPDRGGFFETSSDHEQLVARRKDLEDHPIPSGNASAALGLLRLAGLTGEYSYEQRAIGVLRLLHPLAAQHPQAFAHLLQAIDFHLSPVREVAMAGEPLDDLARVVRSRFRPHVVVAGGEPDGVPLLEGRTSVDGRPAAYVCEHFACRAPVTEPEELATLLDDPPPLG